MERNEIFGGKKRFNKKTISSQIVQKHFDPSFLERNHISPDEKFFIEHAESSGSTIKKNYLLCTTEGEILATFGNIQYKNLCAQQRKETLKNICKNFLHFFQK